MESETVRAPRPTGISPAARRTARWQDGVGLAVFATGTLGGALWLMFMGRGLTFFYDEWDFVEAHRQGLWSAILTPHNGHPSMVPVVIYRILFATVGLHHYWPYRLVLTLLDVACAGGLFALLRRRVHPLVAAAAAASLVVLGPAWQDLLWPFQVGFLGSVCGGLWGLYLLEQNSFRGDIGACGCLVLAVASSGVGLPFLAAAAVELMWSRSNWRRLWVPVVGVGLFLAWYLTTDRANTAFPAPGKLLHFLTQAASATSGAIFGLGTGPGGIIAIVLALMVTASLLRNPAGSARLVAVVTAALVFWVLAVLTRGALLPIASRYLYPGGALILIAFTELLVAFSRELSSSKLSKRIGSTARAVSGGSVALGAVALFGLVVWSNSSVLIQGRDGLLATSVRVRAELGGVQLVGKSLPSNFQPDPVDVPQVTVGPYLQAVHDLGSPANPPTTLGRLNESDRAAIDVMLLRGAPISATAILGPTPTNLSVCHTIAQVGRVVRLPANGLLVRAPIDSPVTVRARLLSSSFASTPVATLPPSRTVDIRWLGSHIALTWTLELVTTKPGTTAPDCGSA